MNMSAAANVSNVSSGKSHKYANPWDDSDAIIKVEEETYHVHTVILGLASPVFKVMFGPNFKEGEQKLVNLPGKKSDTILEMLDLIYPTDFRVNKNSDSKGLLELANEYNMKRLFIMVDDFLCTFIDESLGNFVVAEKYDLSKTKLAYVNYCIKYNLSVYPGRDNYVDWKIIGAESKLAVLIGRVRACYDSRTTCKKDDINKCKCCKKICIDVDKFAALNTFCEKIL